jgi:hypothetical protein
MATLAEKQRRNREAIAPMLAHTFKRLNRPDWLARQHARQRRAEEHLAIWKHCQAYWAAQQTPQERVRAERA